MRSEWVHRLGQAGKAEGWLFGPDCRARDGAPGAGGGRAAAPVGGVRDGDDRRLCCCARAGAGVLKRMTSASPRSSASAASGCARAIASHPFGQAARTCRAVPARYAPFRNGDSAPRPENTRNGRTDGARITMIQATIRPGLRRLRNMQRRPATLGKPIENAYLVALCRGCRAGLRMPYPDNRDALGAADLARLAVDLKCLCGDRSEIEIWTERPDRPASKAV